MESLARPTTRPYKSAYPNSRQRAHKISMTKRSKKWVRYDNNEAISEVPNGGKSKDGEALSLAEFKNIGGFYQLSYCLLEEGQKSGNCLEPILTLVQGHKKSLSASVLGQSMGMLRPTTRVHKLRI